MLKHDIERKKLGAVVTSYYVYFDSGTSNTRIYLLNKACDVVAFAKKSVGSKDSALVGSNRILLEAMKGMYDQILAQKDLADSDIEAIYASGMVTSPFGIREVAHQVLPLTVREFACSLYEHFEDSYFHRNIYLIPGLRVIQPDDFSFCGNMRGEEIEVIGTLDELRARKIDSAAVLTPGSHSHITYVKENRMQDILSTFTGELFHALRAETLLAPVLRNETEELDVEMVEKALDNLNRFGFNRALYLCHAMRIMEEGSERQRFSYAEGVINGGVRPALEYYCQHKWAGCDTLVIVSDAFMYRLFSVIFKGSCYIKRLEWLPVSETQCYTVKGLKKIIELQNS